MKYPRTYHLPFSPEVHSDDKVINEQYLENFINRKVIITEKLDGGNTCLKNGNVYARTHSAPTSHPSFDPIKNIYASIFYLIEDKNLEIYGENMYAIHSIEYTNLTSYFYVFAMKRNNEWLSFDEVSTIAKELGLQTAPIVFRGTFKSIKEIEIFMHQSLKTPSLLGGEKEGFVIRIADNFKNEDFKKYVAKYVRKGHVQSDERWEINWKRAKISDK